jgi:hypothetical protein
MQTILYFSPTGNVRFVAQKLSNCFETGSTKLYPLEFTDPSDLKQTENLILMYSVHAFNALRTVTRFIRNIPEGLCASVSLIAIGWGVSTIVQKRRSHHVWQNLFRLKVATKFPNPRIYL